jgi:hypothetical protein
MNDDLVMESFGYPQCTIDMQYLVQYYYKEIMLCYLVIFLGCNPMNLELSYYLWCQGNLSPPSSTLFSINHLYVEVNFILKESMERRISTSKQNLKRFDVLKAQEFKLGANNNFVLFCFVVCVCVWGGSWLQFNFHKNSCFEMSKYSLWIMNNLAWPYGLCRRMQ